MAMYVSIETPEGPNIGLINNIDICESANMVSSKLHTVVLTGDTHKVTDKIDYLTADEDKHVVAPTNSPLNEDGSY